MSELAVSHGVPVPPLTPALYEQCRGELTALYEHMHEHGDHGHYTLAGILDRYFPEVSGER